MKQSFKWNKVGLVAMTLAFGLTAAGLTGCAKKATTDTVGQQEARPAARAVPASGYSSFELQTEAVRLVKRAPAAADLGQTYDSVIEVHALTQAAGVLVTDTVPTGASLVKTEPQAQVNGSQLSWRIDNLSPGERRLITVTLKADKEGDLTSCSTVTAIPQGCLATVVGKPVLAIEKTGPERARLGTDVAYTITVRNTGSSLARGVVITDTLPEGLTHASGQQALTMNVGDLAPGAVKQYQVAAKASKTGRLCNPATAKGTNVAEVKAEACTVVVEPKLEIAKTGPKEEFIGKTAAYQIVVSNPGDETLTNLTITDTAPAATRIVDAQGATVSGNTAIWKLAELKAGAKQNYSVTLTTATAGNHCNAVAVSAAEGLSARAEACTLWKGVSGILLEKRDTKDPILVGEATQYVVRITNQGTADDTNVRMTLRFPKELKPTTAAGATAGTVDGQTVTFAPFARLAAKQAIEFTVTATGASTGDARVIFELNSDMLNTPVRAEESTHVY